MDINEVPQDPLHFKDRDKVKKLMYAVGKDGKYTSINSAGWEAENTAMKQAWDEIDSTLAEILEKVKNKELSPIAYFMQKNLMDAGLLARYVGKWQWQVRRHCKPAVFNELSEEMYRRYAAVFNISVEELKQFGK